MTENRKYKWSHVGERIKEARTGAGMTRKQVGEYVGVNDQSVWFWEVGRSKPNYEHLVDLASCLDVTTDWLLGRDVVEAEVLEETSVSFRAEIKGLPMEDLESIREFIQFVKQRRRQRSARGDE